MCQWWVYSFICCTKLKKTIYTTISIFPFLRKGRVTQLTHPFHICNYRRFTWNDLDGNIQLPQRRRKNQIWMFSLLLASLTQTCRPWHGRATLNNNKHCEKLQTRASKWVCFAVKWPGLSAVEAQLPLSHMNAILSRHKLAMALLLLNCHTHHPLMHSDTHTHTHTHTHTSGAEDI